MKTKIMLVLLTGAWLLSGCTREVAETQINQERGNQIIQAIERYRQDHKLLPATLKDMSPGYLSEVPLTTDKQAFTYTVDRNDGYYLCFKARGGCCYQQRLDIWDCTGGTE